MKYQIAKRFKKDLDKISDRKILAKVGSSGFEGINV